MKINPKKQSAHHRSLLGASLPLRRALNLAILAVLYPSFSYANPDGAQIVSGQVSIDNSTPGVTAVTNSPNAIINWQNFSIAQNELTQFIQQNGQSAVLNRIIGQNPSEILGQLTSNGKVFLINPNGIVFGAGSAIDTQGLIASSLNLSDQDFLSGNYHFMAGSSAGNIVNEGIIRAGKDGNIILIAPKIENNGIIKTEGGSITLAAGQELTITNLDSPDIRFQIQAPADSALNLGKLLSEGGAINVFASTIKHSGEINADSVQIDKQGRIQLVAQQDTTLTADSKISANNSQGDAGSVHIDSKTGTTLVQGSIEAQAGQSGKGGSIALLGERVGLLDQAHIDASAATGGGQVLIGGDYQGKNPAVHNAKAAYVGHSTTIKADAKTNGNGGKVIVWANEATRAYGDISAKGGSLSGNGGFIETSAHWLDTEGIRINASSSHGLSGEWLLDPFNITIVDGEADVSAVTDPFTSSPSWTATSDSSYLRNSAINTQLNKGTSVTIYTGSAIVGSEVGDITVAANISKTSGDDATLHLKADNAIIINNNIGISSTNNKLNVILNADADASGAGNIQMNTGSSVISNGGDITLGGGANPLTTPARGLAGNPHGVLISHATLNAGTGNINIRGTGTDGTYSASGIYLDALSQLISTTGNISLIGTGGNGLDNNHGIYLDNSTLSTGGAMSITGTGTGSGSNTKGVYLYNDSKVVSGGNLNITANGNGSSGDLLQSDGTTISNLGATGLVTGSSDVTLSGNNLTLADVRSQHHIILNALGNVNLGLPTTNDYVDDRYFTYNLPFTFTFFGTPYSQAYISSNGLITFGDGTGAYSDSVQGLAYYKAIAPAWNDWELHTSSGKNIFISRPTDTDWAVKWNVERYYNSGKTAIFEAVLNSTGNITFNYGAANNSFAGDVTIGLSDGTSAITSQLMTDFTSLNNLKSTTFTPLNGGYTEAVAATGGTLVSTTPVYTGTTGFNLSATNTVLSAQTDITINASGSITQNAILASSGGGNIVLNTGVNYTNNVGIDALNVSGSGRWLIYSTTPANNMLSGLTPAFKHYGCQYLTGCTNYTIPGTGNGLLYSITPVLNITPGTASSRYGSAVNLADLSYTLSGYIDGDTESSANIGGTAGFSTTATSSSSVGSYNIAYNAGLSNALGYIISDNTASVAEYTITPTLLSLTIKADNATRVYGDANPVFTGNITVGELSNGDTLDSIGLSYTTLATSFSNVGTYAITPQITNRNYTFTGIDGQLTVTPHDLIVIGVAAGKSYGALDPVFTYNATGFVNGESSSVLTGALTRTAGETVTAGPYSINQGSLANSNYNIRYTGADFTITPALLSLNIKADDATRVYGDANPVFTGNIAAGELVNGDTLDSIGLSYTTLATPFSNVGTYAITPKLINSNYTFTGIDGQLTVTPHDLIVIGVAAGKTYGALDPVFTYNATGFVNGESSSVLTGALTRTAGETVTAGPYSINQGSLANSNYNIRYTGADFTITPALLSLNIKADDATRVYGDANPVFTGNIAAGELVNGDTLDSIGLSYTTLATPFSNVGTYAITPKLINSNYTFTGIDGQLTVTPHDLIVIGVAAGKTYGALDPVFTYNATGFVNGESSSVLTGALTRTAGETVTAGPYSINQGSLANSNYNIRYTVADFTINALDSITWIGGNGDWSTADNWENSIIPTTGNVLTATIPTGVTVTYDSLAGTTSLNSLSSLGHFQMTGGSLGISGIFNTAQYTQSGGNLSAGSFNVSNAFNQNGGTITADSMAISTVNAIAQGLSGNINAANLTASSDGDVTFAGVNAITQVLDISAGGNIYSRTQGVSRINRLNAPNGWIDVENIGGFILGSTAVNSGTTVANAAGNIVIKAKSPLTVNGTVSSASGSVSLTASNGDTLAINAPISAANGVTLTGGTLTGSGSASYLQSFNTASGGNTLTNSIEEATAVVLGTTPQITQPLADQSSSSNSSNNSAGESLSDTAEKAKNTKQCTK